MFLDYLRFAQRKRDFLWTIRSCISQKYQRLCRGSNKKTLWYSWLQCDKIHTFSRHTINMIRILNPNKHGNIWIWLCVIQVGKTREAIGLDGEVVNRRRTISGPVSELVEAARREQPAPLDFAPAATQPQRQSPCPLINSSSPPPPSPPLPCSGGSGSSSENLPFAEEGSLTIRRHARGEGEGQVTIYLYIYMFVYLSVNLFYSTLSM